MKKMLFILIMVLISVFIPSAFAEGGTIFCRECGSSIPADSKFCSYCGKPVVLVAADEPAEGADPSRKTIQFHDVEFSVPVEWGEEAELDSGNTVYFSPSKNAIFYIYISELENELPTVISSEEVDRTYYKVFYENIFSSFSFDNLSLIEIANRKAGLADITQQLDDKIYEGKQAILVYEKQYYQISLLEYPHISEPFCEEFDTILNSIEFVSESTYSNAAKPANKTLVDNRMMDDVPNGYNSGTENGDLNVSAEYYQLEKSGSTYIYAVVTNPFDYAATVNGNATARDANGNLIGAAQCNIDVVGPGETSIGEFRFQKVIGVHSYDVSFQTSAAKYFSPVVGSLSVDEYLINDGVVVNVTNDGKFDAEFVQAYAIFLDPSNQVIDVESIYVTDDQNRIVPGDSVAVQMDCNGIYDHVKVYFRGRSAGNVSKPNVSADDGDFIYQEYSYPFGKYTYYYLAATNNKDIPVSAEVHALAYDAEDNIIGAAKDDIDVVGPGQSSICELAFNGSREIDHITYKVYYDDTPLFRDVLANLSVEGSINTNNVILSVKNTGTYAAEYVKAYVLFLDTNGNVVSCEEKYITDSDNEIKPGASQVVQLDCKKEFKNVEVLFTGRAS